VAVGALDDARSAIEHERNRLAAVVSQLRIGVIVGNAEGLVLLYNDAARAQVDDQAALGLGRSLLAVVDPALVNAAVPAGTAERGRRARDGRTRR
jgi:DNA polymerase-3 subunit epsilon